MHIRHQLATFGLAQERDHRNDDQKCFQPLAQQDRRCTDEGRKGVVRTRCERRLDIVEELAQHFGTLHDTHIALATPDRGTVFAHCGFDLAQKLRPLRSEHRFERFETVQVGSERELAGLLAITGSICVEAAGEALACQGEQASPLREHSLGMVAQIGRHGAGPLWPECLAERCRSHARKRLEAWNPLPQHSITVPDPFAFSRQRLREREPGDEERQCPALIRRQLRVALHRGVVQTLRDDLVERKDAALARALWVGECSRHYGRLAAAAPSPLPLSP